MSSNTTQRAVLPGAVLDELITSPSQANRAVRIALAAGLGLLALALVTRLSRAPLALARTNVAPEARLAVRKGETAFCQSHEMLPRGTSATAPVDLGERRSPGDCRGPVGLAGSRGRRAGRGLDRDRRHDSDLTGAPQIFHRDALHQVGLTVRTDLAGRWTAAPERGGWGLQ